MKKSVPELKALMDLHATARRLGISEWPNKSGSFCSPLRPDSSESFSIFERDGELKWKDHSPSGDGGGDQIDLIMAYQRCDKKAAIQWMKKELGIEDEYPVARNGKKISRPKRLVATYDYRSADGVLVHQTLRYGFTDEKGGKTFMQRRPASQGEKSGIYEARLDKFTGKWWIWNLYGIEPVLYHLPEMAARPEDEVWLFEGEKDADNAAKMGLLTTTSPMGAGKWRDSFSESLRGRTVTIVPDRDDPGTTHAMMVALALIKSECSVAIVRWSDLWPDAPDGKLDFTDWSENYLRNEKEVEA
jgi:hypothetical protein